VPKSRLVWFGNSNGILYLMKVCTVRFIVMTIWYLAVLLSSYVFTGDAGNESANDMVLMVRFGK
jgi:hypothetical protein